MDPAGVAQQFELLTERDVRGITRLRIAYGAFIVVLFALAVWCAASAWILWRFGGPLSGPLASVGSTPPDIGILFAYVAVSAGVALFLLSAMWQYFPSPIVSIEVNSDGLTLTNSRQRTRRIDLSRPGMRIVIDTRPGPRIENVRGHWGYSRLVSPGNHATCQFDDVVLSSILRLGARQGLRVRKAARWGYGGHVERVTLYR